LEQKIFEVEFLLMNGTNFQKKLETVGFGQGSPEKQGGYNE